MENLIKLLKKDWKEVKKLDQNRKLLIIVLFAVVFVASILIGAFLFAPKQFEQLTSSLPGNQQAQNQIPTSKPSTNLTINPGSGTIAAGEDQQISVDLAGLPVSAIDISLTWDPQLLQVTDLENGDVFQKMIVNKLSEGKIRYSASLSPEEQTSPSTGSVITFTATALEAASGSEVSIQFDPIETITALNGENTLGSTTDATFIVE